MPIPLYPIFKKMKTLINILLIVIITGQINAQKTTSTIEMGKQIYLTGTIETFDSSKHTFDICDTGLGWKSICLIDDNPWFGCDAGMDIPKNQLTKLILTIKGEKIDLDVSGMFNPNWNNELRNNQFKLDSAEVGYYLTGMFSDGAGTYTAKWIIIKDKGLRTKISNDETDFLLHIKE